jgi:hypothetical protein
MLAICLALFSVISRVYALSGAVSQHRALALAPGSVSTEPADLYVVRVMAEVPKSERRYFVRRLSPRRRYPTTVSSRRNQSRRATAWAAVRPG